MAIKILRLGAIYASLEKAKNACLAYNSNSGVVLVRPELFSGPFPRRIAQVAAAFERLPHDLDRVVVLLIDPQTVVLLAHGREQALRNPVAGGTSPA